jgi:hypothetical protein
MVTPLKFDLRHFDGILFIDLQNFSWYAETHTFTLLYFGHGVHGNHNLSKRTPPSLVGMC